MQALALPPQLQRVANFFGGLGEPPPKTERPLRVGVIGASTVATYALLWPARRLPDVSVAAVATRDSVQRARDYARRHGIATAYGSYAELVADPTLDAIYVATPNGLHGEWAAAALRAGRHVLCEKPFAANAAEARCVCFFVLCRRECFGSVSLANCRACACADIPLPHILCSPPPHPRQRGAAPGGAPRPAVPRGVPLQGACVNG
jgi:hypothetical protein